MQPLAYLLARFSEPSSYAGLGAVLALIGWNLSDGAVGQLAQLLAAGCGLLALCLKERGVIPALLFAVALAPALAACGGAPVSLDSAASAGPAIAAGCREYDSAKAAAGAVAAAGIVPPAIIAKIASIETFGEAACARPPSGDPLSTAIWLGRLAGQLATLAAAAH